MKGDRHFIICDKAELRHHLGKTARTVPFNKLNSTTPFAFVQELKCTYLPHSDLLIIVTLPSEVRQCIKINFTLGSDTVNVSLIKYIVHVRNVLYHDMIYEKQTGVPWRKGDGESVA